MKHSMMKISAKWDETRNTFKLIPTDINSTYLEARFNLDQKILILMTKIQYQNYIMLPKLDDNGEVTYKAGKLIQGQKPVMKQERKTNDTFYDCSITERSDIEKMVDFLTGEPNNLDEYYKVPELTEEQKLALAATDGNPNTPKLTKVTK